MYTCREWFDPTFMPHLLVFSARGYVTELQENLEFTISKTQINPSPGLCAKSSRRSKPFVARFLMHLTELAYLLPLCSRVYTLPGSRETSVQTLRALTRILLSPLRAVASLTMTECFYSFWPSFRERRASIKGSRGAYSSLLVPRIFKLSLGSFCGKGITPSAATIL